MRGEKARKRGDYWPTWWLQKKKKEKKEEEEEEKEEKEKEEGQTTMPLTLILRTPASAMVRSVSGVL